MVNANSFGIIGWIIKDPRGQITRILTPEMSQNCISWQYSAINAGKVTADIFLFSKSYFMYLCGIQGQKRLTNPFRTLKMPLRNPIWGNVWGSSILCLNKPKKHIKTGKRNCFASFQCNGIMASKKPANSVTS